ncbi:MAG: FKBP-type peptidyl-prolyl cis-trans isomerase [Thermoplasmata archaeon]|nr:FKBP-type peptidyl-prolyl cis-trans isomerase [Thermoplasmata archaeon]
MDVEKVCMGILLASILFIAGLVVWDLVGDKFKKSEEKKEETLVVKEGDKVTVDYIGRFPNGEVFDTSIRAIADNPLIPKSPGFTPQSTYQPLEFVVGSGRMIKGFEDGVIGMRVGETRNITVPPEEGYGPADPNLIMWIPETEFVPLFVNLTVEQFKENFSGEEPKVDAVYTHPFWGWPCKVVKIEGDRVTFQNTPRVGERYKAFPWNSTVEDISVEQNRIVVRHYTSEIEGYIRIPLEHFKYYNSTLYNYAKGIPDSDKVDQAFVHVEGGNIKVDFNKEVKGKTLLFEVHLLKISRGD